MIAERSAARAEEKVLAMVQLEGEQRASLSELGHSVASYLNGLALPRGRPSRPPWRITPAAASRIN